MTAPHQLEIALCQFLRTAGVETAMRSAFGLGAPNDADSYILPATSAGTLPDNAQPCIVCRVGAGQESPQFSKNYLLPVTIEATVNGVPSDQQPASKEAFSAVCEAIDASFPSDPEQFCALINAAARTQGLTLTCQGILDASAPETNFEGDCWTASFSFTAYACTATID